MERDQNDDYIQLYFVSNISISYITKFRTRYSINSKHIYNYTKSHMTFIVITLPYSLTSKQCMID